jgi:hypothetical protein
MKTIKFEIIHQNFEKDNIEVLVESGDPHGDIEEFREYMRNAILNWYDGLKISNSHPEKVDTNQNMFTKIKNFFMH